MKSTLQKPVFIAARTPKAGTIFYGTGTELFCVQMSFTAFALTDLTAPEESGIAGLIGKAVS
jgi:hypothetical protein